MTVHELQMILDRAEPESEVFCVAIDSLDLQEHTFEVDEVGVIYVDGQVEVRLLEGEEV